MTGYAVVTRDANLQASSVPPHFLYSAEVKLVDLLIGQMWTGPDTSVVTSRPVGKIRVRVRNTSGAASPEEL